MDDVSQNTYLFTASLTFGTGSCLDKVQIHVDAIDANMVKYEVSSPSRASAILTRDAEPDLERT
ncbi:hypothetical protein [Arthrobacter sp. TMS1-12-1]